MAKDLTFGLLIEPRGFWMGSVVSKSRPAVKRAGLRQIAVQLAEYERSFKTFTTRFRHAFLDWRPFWKSNVKPAIVASVKESFDEQKGPTGSWAPLDSVYKKKKNWMKERNYLRGVQQTSVKFGGDVIGKQTGTMHTAMTAEKRFGNIVRYRKDSFEWGVNLARIPYARKFARGGKGQPPRPIQFLSRDRLEDLKVKASLYTKKLIDDKAQGTLLARIRIRR